MTGNSKGSTWRNISRAKSVKKIERRSQTCGKFAGNEVEEGVPRHLPWEGNWIFYGTYNTIIK